MAIAECPACTFHIADTGSMQAGDLVVCPDCGSRLRLAKNYPPVFELAGEE